MTKRAEGKLAGYAYLAYIVFATSAAVLSGKTTPGADTSHMLSTLRGTIAITQVAVHLDLLQIVCAVVLAVTLYRLSRTVDATVALLAMALRLGEGLADFVPLLGNLKLMKLATASSSMCASSTTCPTIANEILDCPDDILGQFCFVVGGFLLAYLLLAGLLIPPLDGMNWRNHDRATAGLCASVHPQPSTWRSRESALVSHPPLQGNSWDVADA